MMKQSLRNSRNMSRNGKLCNKIQDGNHLKRAEIIVAMKKKNKYKRMNYD